MAKKQEKQIKKNDDIETIEVSSAIKETSIKGKQIIIKSIPQNFKTVDVHYFIRKDGSINEGDAVEGSNIIIGLLEGNQVSWTMIMSMIKKIKELQKQGAGTIKRYDDFHPGLTNPLFNLTHALTKFSIR